MRTAESEIPDQFEEARFMLDREAAMAELDRARPGSILLVDAPPGGGKSTTIDRWLELRGRSAHRVPAAKPDRLDHLEQDSTVPPDVLLIDAATGSPDALRAAIDRFPRAITLVLSCAGWPSQWRLANLSPDQVITGSMLAFTTAEIQALGALRGLSISDDLATRVVAATAGLPSAAAATVHAAAAGEVSAGQALASGCDCAVATLQARYPSELIHPLIVLATMGQAHAGTARLLWSAVQDGSAVLSMLWSARVVTDGDLLNTVRLPAGFRDAFRRLGADNGRLQSEAISAAVARLIQCGRYADLVQLAAIPAQRDVVLPQLAQVWNRLVDVPAPALLGVLTPRKKIKDLLPHLALAAARAHLDVTHAGHRGRVGQAEILRAEELLDSPGVRKLTDASAVKTCAMLWGIIDRSRGRLKVSIAAFDWLLRDRQPGELTATIHLHAGLSAFAAHRQAMARRHCAIASLMSGYAVRAELTQASRDITAILNVLEDDPGRWWKETTARAWDREGERTSRGVELMDAVLQVDLPKLRALEPRIYPSLVAEPHDIALIQVHFEALALNALQRPAEGIEALSEMVVQVGPTSPRARHLLVTAYADLLAAAGRGRQALEALGHMDWHEVPDGVAGPRPLDLSLYRARVLLSLERFEESSITVRSALVNADQKGGRLVIWANVLLSLTARALGRDDEARRCLKLALVAGCEADILFPFLRHGKQHLGDLIDFTERLDLDEETHRFVSRLGQVREELPREPGDVRLSGRQLEALRLLQETSSVRSLARRMTVSESTVKAHLAQIYRKLGVSGRTEALHIGRLQGLLDEHV